MEHVGAVRKQQSLLREKQVNVVLVTFVGRDELEAWWQEQSLGELQGWLGLIDTERTLYTAFKFGSSTARSWSPGTLWFYLKRVVVGDNRIQRPVDNADLAQLGGDVVVRQDKSISLLHRSRTPIDRPTWQEIFKALQ
mmetsp:Transcript_64741/g.153073  ORF Transcript_64741/g.153073 Transcript_64741/m.153073 type:complete len:138 (-) Transcript_64741:184-597(-)